MFVPPTEPLAVGTPSAETLVPVIVAAKAVALTLGVVVTHRAVRAARTTEVRGLRRLAVGFGVVTAGVVAGGAVYALTGLGLLPATLVQSGATAVGFAIIAHSLYVGESHQDADAGGCRGQHA
jgi:methyl coenzyme M reductase beta subunit